MKIEVLYYELKRKEFRSRKTLSKFIKSKLPSEIVRAYEKKNGAYFNLELRSFINEFKYDAIGAIEK